MIGTSRRPLALLAVLAGLTLAACSDDSGGTGPAPAAMLMLRNDANVAIKTVYFDDCSASDWSANRLAAGEVIEPNGLRKWTVEPGCYDVRASTGQKFGTWWDRQVTKGDTLKLALSSAADSNEMAEPVSLGKRRR